MNDFQMYEEGRKEAEAEAKAEAKAKAKAKLLLAAVLKKTSWRHEKCFHCGSSNNDTERISVSIDGSEEWKCYDCGRCFVLSEYSR